MTAKEIIEIINIWETNRGLILTNKDKIRLARLIEAKSKEEAEEKIDIESMCMSILKKYGLESESLIGGQQTLALMVECVEAAFGKEGEG